ncbi:hypothetical protein [Neisseria sp.]|nr:hypothetical protein [Neisseria sp.]
MGGFDTEAVSRALSLPENYLPVLLIAIGKPAGEQQQKIRFNVDKVLDII